MTTPAPDSDPARANRFNRAAVFVNAQSGHRRSRALLPQIELAFRTSGVDCGIFQTASAADLANQARHQVRAGAELLFAAGGDGTLQRLVNSAFGQDVVLGIIPSGGGNDFARALGLPRDPVTALKVALSGELRAIDLVKVRTGDGRECFYLGGGGVGLDAAAAAYAGGPYRNFPGRMRYVAAALRAYFSYQPRRVRVTFESDDTDQVWQSALLASVLNTPTFGAGIRLAPGAQIDDGVFEFVFLEELRFGQLLRVLPRLALQGSINLPGLQIRRARKLRIEVDPPATFHGDGELLGSSPVEIEIVPRAMRFLAPKAGAR
jgi:diacylglycerol kinase (ATP)